MTKESIARILENTCIAKDTFQLSVESELASVVKCGQFMQIKVPGFFLRRPISVCETGENRIVFVYRVVGDGTKVLSELKEGQQLSLLGPLGSGFPTDQDEVILVGGGLGVPPLLETAKVYRQKDKPVSVVLGFNDRESEILVERFESLGCAVYTATMDGSDGTKGTVIDAIRENGLNSGTVMACGPLPMLKAVSEHYQNGYISLESRMGCGIGSCMGCVVKGTDGESYRVCKDGPVFPIGKVVL